jgi:hypothetical protein
MRMIIDENSRNEILLAITYWCIRAGKPPAYTFCEIDVAHEYRSKHLESLSKSVHTSHWFAIKMIDLTHTRNCKHRNSSLIPLETYSFVVFG